MVIRDRILLVAVLAMLGVAAIGLWFADMRVQVLEQGAARQAVAGQAALWKAVVSGRLDELDAAKMLLRGRISGRGEQADALETAYADLNGQFGVSRIELFGTDGRLVQRVPALRGSFAAVSSADTWTRGIGQNESRGYVLYSSIALGDSAGALNAVVSAPLGRALSAFTAAKGGEAALLDLRGAPIAVAGDESLGQFAKDLPSLGEAAYRVARGGRPTDVVSTFVTDSSGRPLAQLVSLAPAAGAQPILGSRVTLLVALATATLLLAALVAWYVRTAMAPVDNAVAALESLADGDTAISLPAVVEADESGRLVTATRALRTRAMTYVQLRIARERQGQRQQRFIRMQMEALANMLEPEARTSILADLNRLEQAAREAAAAGRAAGAEAGEDFGLLAAAFENMAVRIRDQYAALGALVIELKEALKAKNDYIALQKELEIAQRLQLSILPHSFSPRDGLAISAMMTPAKEVGGDFYDFFEIDEERIGVVVADVSGKGVPAALFMAISRTLLRAIGLLGDSPGRVLQRLNDLLAAENEEMMFVTMFYAVIEPRKGRMTYANGGHNRPTRLRADGAIDMLPGTAGTALAVMPGIAYQEQTIEFQPGDCFLLYTDGVTEAFDVDDTEFGDARLIETMARLSDTPTGAVPQAVIDDVCRFARGAPQSDDITCVAISFQREKG